MRPARTAIARSAGGQFTTPPSEPTQGTLPAPRQGVSRGFTCAQSAVALNKTPHAMKSKRSIRIAQSPLWFNARVLAFRAPISSTSTVNCVVELVWAHLYTGVHLDKTELFMNLAALAEACRGWYVAVARL